MTVETVVTAAETKIHTPSSPHPIAPRDEITRSGIQPLTPIFDIPGLEVHVKYNIRA